MKNLSVEKLLFMNNNISTAKAAIILAMVDDGNDEMAVEYLKSQNMKCVITRAGGRGDNLKDKLFRNSLTAAENSGIIEKNTRFKYIFFNVFSKLFEKLDKSVFGISGAGFKIGIVRTDDFISIAISGKMGIPGLNIDYDILEVESDYINIQEEE
ncbi:MAG: hypothetical protein C0601_08970 [Candidatus Muiribacterium halophilum]|uniref:Hut operon positive regulatory protein n=1 Tax=Muiribacterium halophilum TaxID=2053465 RepID=A0A2N5ZE21_MUIH1|nr:MAG: hypothetical protein C0601_08970 [Candidatus Muirbacterium halophilum]